VTDTPQVDFCPRCGTRREIGRNVCAQCGLNLTTVKVGAPAGDDYWVRRDPPESRDVRLVSDRQTMARVSRAALDVRCLGTLGALAGLLVGFIIGGYVGLALGGAMILITLPVGLVVGAYFGMRVALGWAARE
jgi:hypothetical protein